MKRRTQGDGGRRQLLLTALHTLLAAIAVGYREDYKVRLVNYWARVSITEDVLLASSRAGAALGA